jgi:hypothetical protein
MKYALVTITAVLSALAFGGAAGASTSYSCRYTVRGHAGIVIAVKGTDNSAVFCNAFNSALHGTRLPSTTPQSLNIGCMWTARKLDVQVALFGARSTGISSLCSAMKIGGTTWKRVKSPVRTGWVPTVVKSAPPAKPAPHLPPAPTPAAPGSSRAAPFPIQTAGLTDASGWKVTVVSVNFDGWPLVLAENQFNDAPAAGNVDVLVEAPRFRGHVVVR